jgi:hypothetical protein
VPARSDTVDVCGTAYGVSLPVAKMPAATDGWYDMEFDTHPAIISERQSFVRPDLGVDSVKYITQPPQNSVKAWVRNHGTRATPHHTPGNLPYPTWAVLYANGDSLAQQVRTDSIAVGQTVTFTFTLGAVQPTYAVLYSVRVNPNEEYVELGTDDNSGYRLKPRP